MNNRNLFAEISFRGGSPDPNRRECVKVPGGFVCRFEKLDTKKIKQIAAGKTAQVGVACKALVPANTLGMALVSARS